MKKRLAFLMALVLAISLCACTAKPDPAPSDSAASPAAPSDTGDAPAPISWPNGDVTVYIAAEVGSPTDNSVRVALDWLSEQTGVNFIPENDGSGESARLGALLTNAEPDGQTLMASSLFPITSYYKGVWEDNLADPEAYAMICTTPMLNFESGNILLTQKDMPFDTLQELIEYVNENPGQLTCATTPGKTAEIRIRLLFDYFGLTEKVRWVSAGNADTLTGLLSGNISLALLDEVTSPQYIDEGTLKGLFITRLDREYDLPEFSEYLDAMQIIPDVIEDEAEAKSLTMRWPGVLYGPAGMSEEFCAYINEIMCGILEDEAYMARIENLGGTNWYYPMTNEELWAHVADAEKQVISIFGQP